jgi:hypothetical protein
MCHPQREGLGPHQLAFDRPSAKLLPFMQRHFQLVTYTPQSNHFVLFHEYFKDPANTAATRTKTVSCSAERRDKRRILQSHHPRSHT